jgi:hypothetical protein
MHLYHQGHPGRRRRQGYHWLVCQSSFQENHGTSVPPAALIGAVGALAEGVNMRAVARMFTGDPHTMLVWWGEVADHAAAFSRSFLHDGWGTPVQLDDLFT